MQFVKVKYYNYIKIRSKVTIIYFVYWRGSFHKIYAYINEKSKLCSGVQVSVNVKACCMHRRLHT